MRDFLSIDADSVFRWNANRYLLWVCGVNGVGFYRAESYLCAFLEEGLKPPSVLTFDVKGVFFALWCVSCDTDFFCVLAMSFRDREEMFSVITILLVK